MDVSGTGAVPPPPPVTPPAPPPATVSSSTPSAPPPATVSGSTPPTTNPAPGPTDPGAVPGATAGGGPTTEDVIAAGRQNVAELNRAQILAARVQTEFSKAQIMRTLLQSSAQR